MAPTETAGDVYFVCNFDCQAICIIAFYISVAGAAVVAKVKSQSTPPLAAIHTRKPPPEPLGRISFSTQAQRRTHM